ncbi:hypothetical protein [Parafrankia sp. EUN1f]|uniref:hypothetical protein n=1 Tax=Parafrankia sp. EUN1f TaxID=102897 RepID=UPI0001C47828|nr:hypothetical protein [Parafrankia sp. EUN1f]EFC79423.1 hypothetical protein FrEUN1fDRAFT_7464 [Parafrankia sp. EUN1f]
MSSHNLDLPRPRGRVPGIEMEVYVDWEDQIEVEDPPNSRRPAVMVRMPAYVAGGLSHELHSLETIRGAIGGDCSEWAQVARALLAAARMAAGSDRHPELADLPAAPFVAGSDRHSDLADLADRPPTPFAAGYQRMVPVDGPVPGECA